MRLLVNMKRELNKKPDFLNEIAERLQSDVFDLKQEKGQP